MNENRALMIVDEYLEEVRKYLPQDIADDVIAELRTHILDKAEDMGGLTVENVYAIIHRLGDPRRLASRYVVGRGRKRLRFELGISEDLYPYFIAVLLFSVIMSTLGFTVAIISKIMSGEPMTIGWIARVLLVLVSSIIVIPIFLYIAFSVISSNPEWKDMVLDTIHRFLESLRFPEKKKTSPPEKEKIYRHSSPWGRLVSAILLTIIAYVVYLYGSMLSLNWLMTYFLYTLTIFIAVVAIFDYVYFFYILYYERESYLLNTIRNLFSLIFVPWFFIANIYTEDIQIITFDYNPEKKTFEDFIGSIRLMEIPPEYIILAKIVTLLILLSIIIGLIITILKYVRTQPSQKKHDTADV